MLPPPKKICEHYSESLIFLHPQQNYTTSQLIHTGDISFGERTRDERDDLLAGGSWPTLDNSSRLNRHTWSASQPSAGTVGVWCMDPHRTGPCPGLAWTLFRWLPHMLSSLNRCPIMLHLMCLLPETKHSLIHSCTAAPVEANREYEGKPRVNDEF